MRLSDSRYEEIKTEVASLYRRCGYDTIPVDPLAIAGRLGVVVIRYSSLGGAGENAARQKSPSGFTFILEGHDGDRPRFIYYNDRHPMGRQRFTLLHEIGHVVPGHLGESEIAEAEANFFAKFAIAPPSLVNVIGPSDYMDIADAFGLSAECALNSWTYYRRWLCSGGEKPYERTLRDLFVVASQTDAEQAEGLRGCVWGGGRVA